ncbi:hypothetical protein EDB83DRAFT_2316616 [Lactarius deliciosus]|nr:hypothetical protein EDB83DRAFT_2316616 [Lactarius deliciosus]
MFAVFLHTNSDSGTISSTTTVLKLQASRPSFLLACLTSFLVTMLCIPFQVGCPWIATPGLSLYHRPLTTSGHPPPTVVAESQWGEPHSDAFGTSTRCWVDIIVASPAASSGNFNPDLAPSVGLEKRKAGQDRSGKPVLHQVLATERRSIHHLQAGDPWSTGPYLCRRSLMTSGHPPPTAVAELQRGATFGCLWHQRARCWVNIIVPSPTCGQPLALAICSSNALVRNVADEKFLIVMSYILLIKQWGHHSAMMCDSGQPTSFEVLIVTMSVVIYQSRKEQNNDMMSPWAQPKLYDNELQSLAQRAQITCQWQAQHFKQMHPDFRHVGSINLLPLAFLRLLTGLALVTHRHTPGVPTRPCMVTDYLWGTEPFGDLKNDNIAIVCRIYRRTVLVHDNGTKLVSFLSNSI